MSKHIGRITNIRFGIGGKNDACIGLFISFGTNLNEKTEPDEILEATVYDTIITTDKVMWDSTLVPNPEPNWQWDESDRTIKFAEIVRFISQLLADARVKSLSALKGAPVELTLDDQNLLTAWKLAEQYINSADDDVEAVKPEGEEEE